MTSERKFGQSQRSSSELHFSETEMDHKKTLQELNSRLVSYVEKVRKLQMATDVIDAMPKQKGINEQSLLSMKQKFEAEIEDWKTKLGDAQNTIAQLKIEISNKQQENKTLTSKVNDKLGLLKERESHISNLEVEIQEILSKLNILQNEKGKLMDNEAVYKSDLVDMKKELDGSRKNYDREKVKNADLKNQLSGLEQDLKFKIQLLETELIEEKKKNKIDFNAIDKKMKSDYETRLSAEMDSLRRVYEEQTEKARNEYMNLHSQKLSNMQEELTMERTKGQASRAEMEDWRARVEQMRGVLSQLEEDKLRLHTQLHQQNTDLNNKLEEKGSTFRSQLKSKDSEVGILQREINKMRVDYERLVEIKQALAMEIAVYKNIIEGEEKRIRKVSRKFSSRMTDQSNYESMSDSDAERRFKSVDEFDGRSFHVKSRQQSRTVRCSKSTKY